MVLDHLPTAWPDGPTNNLANNPMNSPTYNTVAILNWLSRQTDNVLE